jgi:anti-sigma regulatory factor (Ser/Thr protein kinase)
VNDERRAGPSLSLEFPNDAEALIAAREEVRRHLHDLPVDEAAIYAIDLTLEELCGNTLRYGYAEQTKGAIRVSLALAPDHVLVSIADDARAFDPTQHPEPERAPALRAAPLGGRGISMVRRMARAMRYRREAGVNRIEVEVPRGAASS